MECLDVARCLSDAYADAPVIGSNPEPDSYHATAGCGAQLLEAGTMEQCQQAVEEHRNTVRAEHGEGS